MSERAVGPDSEPASPARETAHDQPEVEPATPAVVRDLITRTDWSRSPLGPAHAWPPELRSALEMMLGSAHPLVVCWGPELVFLYNDALVPAIGRKHPGGFGRPVREVWPEIWDRIGRLLEGVLRTGEPVTREHDRLVVHRGEHPEETFWHYSYSPIRDAGGRILGVFAVVSESTAQTVATRRMELVGRLAEIGHQTGPPGAHVLDTVVSRAADVLDDARNDIAWALLVSGRPGGETGMPVSAGLAGPPPSSLLDRYCRADPGSGEIEPVPVEGPLPAGVPHVRHVVPVTLPGLGGGQVRVLLGVAPERPLDAEHLAFLRLVTGHVRAAVNTARAVAERSMVDSLRDVTRMDPVRVDARFAPIDLGALTAELAGLFRPAAERAGLRMDIDCHPGVPVWADQDLWERIVLNLLSNALKFTFDGSIRLSTQVDRGQFVLRVSDTGAGIPAEEQGRVFERFHRVPGTRTRSAEGQGTGLTTVRHAVGLHGGTVEIASTVGVGTTFAVRVPLGHEHLPADRVTTSEVSRPLRQAHPRAPVVEPFLAEVQRWLPQRPGEPTRPLAAELPDQRGHVLVVDDDEDSRQFLQRLLSEAWSVQAVGDGTEALDVALANPPDLLVVDATMRGLDGIALLRALRADPRTAGLPVVLLSERAGEEAAVEALAAGADDYLVKPFSARELLARVANHLELGRVRRAAELRFRAMADSTPAMIWVDDVGGHRVFVNRGWLDFTGVTDPVGELGQDWRRRIHPEDRDRYEATVAAAVRVAEPFEIEYRLRRHDGHYRWVIDRGQPIGAGAEAAAPGAGGRPAGYVGGCLDIHARRSEQRRHEVYARFGEMVEGELGQDARMQALADMIVDEGLADIVRVHDGWPGAHARGTRTGVRAVAASDPDLVAGLADMVVLLPHPELMAAGEPIQLTPDGIRAALAAFPPPTRVGWERLGLGALLKLPLRARGGTLGMLTVGRTGATARFDEADVEMFAELARRAGIAIDNARLLEQERATADRLDLLHRATAQMSAAATPAEVACIAADHLVALFGAPVAGAWELRGDTLHRLVVRGSENLDLDAMTTLRVQPDHPPGDALLRGRPLWFTVGAEWRAQYPRAAEGLQDWWVEASCVLPLVVGQRSLGILAVGFVGPREFSASDREAALAVAELAAQALDRSLLLVAETEARRQAERLGAIATALSRATSLEAVADVVVSHALAAVDADAVVLLAVQDDTLVPLAEEGWPPGHARPSTLPAGSAHLLAQVVRTGEPVWAGLVDAAGPYPVRMALPMLVGGTVIGALGFGFGEGSGGGKSAEGPTPTEREFLLTLASQCAQALMRARLHQAEHEVAVTLQRSLLPQTEPELERLAVGTRYMPGTQGTEAGGDWFDVLDLDDDLVALVVGDVVGRGPSAAAVMGQLRSALAANLVNGQPPATALEQLDLFARRVEGARASTAACVVVDCTRGELRYACAGHPPPLVAGQDGVRVLAEGRGTPLGVRGRPPYSEAVAHLAPGETILLCSDGLFERRGEAIDDGLARLVDVFGGLARYRPKDVLEPLLDRMLADSGAPDDTVVLLARMLPEPLHRALPANPAQLRPMRRAVEAWSRECGLDDDTLTDLQLALGEAVTNAVEHAYPGGGTAPDAVALTLRSMPDGSVEVQVRDHGRWRPPPVDPGYRGRGLGLIREVAEDVGITGTDTGTRIHFRIPASPAVLPGAAAPSGAATAAAAADREVPPGVTRTRRTVEDGQVHFEIEGDLDLAGVGAIRNELAEEPGPGGTLTLSLTADAYVSSAGIALLSELVQRACAGGWRLAVLAPPRSPAERMLALVGLDEVVVTDRRAG